MKHYNCYSTECKIYLELGNSQVHITKGHREFAKRNGLVTNQELKNKILQQHLFPKPLHHKYFSIIYVKKNVDR